MESKSTDEKLKKTGNPNPYLKANWFSKLSFWWLNNLFSIGYRKSLEKEDIYDTIPEDSAEKLAETLHRKFYIERNEKNKKKGKLQLLFDTLGMFPRELTYASITPLIWEIIKIFQPMLLAILMSYFDPSNTEVSDREAYMAGVVLPLTAFICSFFPIFYMHTFQLVSMRMRAAIGSLIYRKTLTLSQKSLADISTGKIINLMSTDVEKFQNGIIFTPFNFIVPIEIAVITWLLYEEVGVAAFAGLAYLFVYAPTNILVGTIFGRMRLKIAKWTDKRILIMNELIGGMRVIKIYCWEKPFGKIIERLRGKEIQQVFKALSIKGQSENIVFVSSKLVSFFIILVYYLQGNIISPEITVKVLTWTDMLRMQMLMLSLGAQYGTEMYMSLGRIQEFLVAEDLEECPKDKMNNGGVVSCGEVSLDDVTVYWDTPQTEHTNMQENIGFHMKNICIRVPKGELVAIVGPVGSGKSSLLMTMMGEMPLKAGTVDLSGKVVYVPQEAWIFSGSIRDNVLFGKDLDVAKYQDTVHACALDKDFKTLEYGDQSIVGEKGYSLSGGQKARINFARAAYQDADIYLLDDPLSAVDANVGKHIFNRCIKEKLRNKTRILVTHQIQFLRQVDRIYVLKEGKIINSGTYSEVSQAMDMGSLLAKEEETKSQKVISAPQFQRTESIRSTNSGSIHMADHDNHFDDIDEEGAQPPSEEERSAGSIGLGVYVRYFAAGFGAVLFPLFILCAVISQAGFNLSDWVLSQWESNKDNDDYFYYYLGLVIGMVIFGSLRSFIFFNMAALISKNLHNSMFAILLRAPISFFDQNPVGRILNRFSRDIGFMDDILPQITHQVLMFGFQFLGTVVVVSVANPWSILIMIPVFIAVVVLRRYSIKTLMEVKRLEAAARSPSFSHLSATLQGLPVIRAFKMEQEFIKKFYRYQDEQTSAWNLFLSGFRWFGLRIDWFITVYFIGCVVAAFVTKSEDSAAIGLSLSYILTLLGVFQYVMRQTAEVESYMTSVERVLQYTDLDQEDPPFTDLRPSPDWPSRGEITFDHLHLSYSSDHIVLKDINITFKSQEKIGVVGRTGAGKTSLLSCLFRLTEPSQGTVWIDGIDINKLGLTDLRRNISIIPQDPVLFRGRVRYNLDPFGEYEDEQIWKALSGVHLWDMVRLMPGGLDAEISEAGSNFSVGQKQLLCLARAILRNNRLLVIDEATANVDFKTDHLIQQTLRNEFKNCTVMTIAHRLNTIIDSDRILVLDKGEVSQFDKAYNLLQDENGIFYNMVKLTGAQNNAKLHQLAKLAYEKMTEDTEYVNMQIQSVDSRKSGTNDVETIKMEESKYAFINNVYEIDGDETTYL